LFQYERLTTTFNARAKILFENWSFEKDCRNIGRKDPVPRDPNETEDGYMIPESVKSEPPAQASHPEQAAVSAPTTVTTTAEVYEDPGLKKKRRRLSLFFGRSSLPPPSGLPPPPPTPPPATPNVLFIQEDERIVMKPLGARPRTGSKLGMLKKKFKNPDPEEDSDFAKIMARQRLRAEAGAEGGESIEMSNL
jgi:hypothetical protein